MIRELHIITEIPKTEPKPTPSVLKTGKPKSGFLPVSVSVWGLSGTVLSLSYDSRERDGAREGGREGGRDGGGERDTEIERGRDGGRGRERKREREREREGEGEGGREILALEENCFFFRP